MSLWRRLKSLIGGGESSALEEGPTESLPTGEPEIPTAALELQALAEPEGAIEPDRIRAAVAKLREQGRELEAIELLGRALRARPGEIELEAALAFALAARLDFDAARPLLERLSRTVEYGLAAELLLGECAERAGDPVEALRHYERVLAKDVTHSQALNRAKQLRERLGSSAPTAQSATVVQPEGASTKGRYQLIRELGRGGAAAVYLARDKHLERDVALKVYHPQVMSEDGPAQLAREAALPARVRHGGIIKVLDVDPGLGALIMEVVAGGSLKDRLKRGTMPLDEALAAIEALCRPLAALHAAGIVHRDVKPGNVLLRGDGVDDPVLTDLGVALLPGEAHRPGVGTPAYMAPEQRSEASLDPRADVYAIGVMLAAMLGGYPGPAGPVGDLLDRCLSESPGGRPRDAGEVGQAVATLRFAARRQEELRADLARVAELSERQRARS